MISREQAIDAVRATLLAWSFMPEWRDNKIIEAVEQLPPIQPVIVRCKDCKHRDPEDKKCDCGHDILWQLPRRNDWFCADGERRENNESN